MTWLPKDLKDSLDEENYEAEAGSIIEQATRRVKQAIQPVVDAAQPAVEAATSGASSLLSGLTAMWEDDDDADDASSAPQPQPAPVPSITAPYEDPRRPVTPPPAAATVRPSAMPTAPRRVLPSTGEPLGSVTITNGGEPLGDISEGDPAGFFATAGPYARRVEQETGIPAVLALAIAANETGYGQRRYMAGSNNYHGIQAQPGEPGAVPYKDWRPDGAGGQVFYDAAQRSFASPLAGFQGFASFLRDNPRYGQALARYQQSGDVEQLARDIHAAGYAEDPAWSDKLISIMRGIPTATGVGEVTDTRGVGLTGHRLWPPLAERAGPSEADRYEVAFGFDQPYDTPFNPNIPRHRGVDLVVRGGKDNGRGEPVRAFRGGKVVSVTSDPNGGNGLILQGEDGLYEYYGHFDATNVRAGQEIKPGDQIGVLGASGTEGFPHLHYEVRRDINGDPMGQTIDPTPYMRAGGGVRNATVQPAVDDVMALQAQPTGPQPMPQTQRAPEREMQRQPLSLADRLAALWSDEPIEEVTPPHIPPPDQTENGTSVIDERPTYGPPLSEAGPEQPAEPSLTERAGHVVEEGRRRVSSTLEAGRQAIGDPISLVLPDPTRPGRFVRRARQMLGMQDVERDDDPVQPPEGVLDPRLSSREALSNAVRRGTINYRADVLDGVGGFIRSHGITALEPLAEWFEQDAGRIRRYLHENPRLNRRRTRDALDGPMGLAEAVAETLPSILPTVLGTLLGVGGLGQAATIVQRGSMALGALSAAGSTARELRAEGVDPMARDIVAAGAGLTEIVTEMLFPGIDAKLARGMATDVAQRFMADLRNRGLVGAGKNILREAGQEGVEELVAESYGVAVDSVFKEKKPTLAEAARRLAAAGVTGAAIGGGLTAGTQAVQAAGDRAARRRVGQDAARAGQAAGEFAMDVGREAAERAVLGNAPRMVQETGGGSERSQTKASGPDDDSIEGTPTTITANEPSFVDSGRSSVDSGAKPSKYEFSSTQLDLPEPVVRRVRRQAAKIADEDLAPDGRDDSPHTTVFYGLETADPDDVRAIIERHPPITVKLGKTSIFPDDGQRGSDVVKVDVESDALRALNAELARLPNGNKYPEFRPHVTLGYTKPGKGKKYAGSAALAGQEVTINSVTFSSKNGERVSIPLAGRGDDLASAARQDSQQAEPEEDFDPLTTPASWRSSRRPLPGTNQRVYLPSAAPQELTDEVSRRPYAAQTAKLAERLHRGLSGSLPSRAARARNSQMVGLQFTRSPRRLAVNFFADREGGPNRIYIDPWKSYRSVREAADAAGVSPDSPAFARMLADDIVESVAHEYAHNLAAGHHLGHRALTRIAKAIISRESPGARRLFESLRRNGQLAMLEQDAERLMQAAPLREAAGGAERQSDASGRAAERRSADREGAGERQSGDGESLPGDLRGGRGGPEGDLRGGPEVDARGTELRDPDGDAAARGPAELASSTDSAQPDEAPSIQTPEDRQARLEEQLRELRAEVERLKAERSEMPQPQMRQVPTEADAQPAEGDANPPAESPSNDRQVPESTPPPPSETAPKTRNTAQSGAQSSTPSNNEPPAPPSGPPPEPEPGRLRGFGYYRDQDDTGSLLRGVRAEYEDGELRTVPMAETRARAERILALDPGAIQAHQDAILAEGTTGRADISDALRLQAYADEQATIRAAERLVEAQERVKNVGDAGMLDDEAQLEVADALLAAAEAVQRMQRSGRASTAEGTATARALAQRRGIVIGRRAWEMAERAKAAAKEAEDAAGVAKRSAGNGGKIGEHDREKLRRIRDRLVGPDGERLPAPGDGVGGHLDEMERRADEAKKARERKGKRGGKVVEPSAENPDTTTSPREESYAERLGRLKRQRGLAEDAGDMLTVEQYDERISELLEEIKADANERARKIAARTKRPLTAEEAERAVNEAAGRAAVNRIQRDAIDRATGRDASKLQAQLDRETERRLLAALKKHEAEAQRLAESINVQTQRGIERAFEQERRAEVRRQVAEMAEDARRWMKRAREMPNEQELREELDFRLRVMADHSTLGEVTADALREQFETQLAEDAFRFMADVEKRVADAARKAQQDGDRARLKELHEEARTWLQRAIKDPGSPAIEEEFQRAASDLAGHSLDGGKLALALLDRLEDAKAEAAFKFNADVERRIAEAARKEAERMRKEIEASRIRGVVAQIDELLANPQAPGAVERWQGLQSDLTAISVKGFEKASDLRKRLFRANLIKAGMASKTEDVEPLVNALASIERRSVEARLAGVAFDERRALRDTLNVISTPRLWDLFREIDYINLLSSPITNMINFTSNTMNAAGRVFMAAPLEAAFIAAKNRDLTRLAEAGAAVAGAGKGLSLGAAEAKQIMRTGISDDDMQRATETGDTAHVSRELLAERFGWAGQAAHIAITRPMEAGDEMIGSVAWWSGFQQHAARQAARMAREAGAFKGDAPGAYQHILANPWDYPDIIRAAGRIKNYTILKGPAESALEETVDRGVGTLRSPQRLAETRASVMKRLTGRTHSTEPGFESYAIAAMANFAVAFYKTPSKYFGQGVDKVVSPVAAPIRATIKAKRGELTEDEAARYFQRATIGATVMTTAILLAIADNLTGDGPEDEDDRRVWEATHKRQSFRLPGTDWISWKGTPWGIPFAVVASVKEEYDAAVRRAEKQGARATETQKAIAIGKGISKGAAEGLMSQSFVQNLESTYKGIAGEGGFENLAANAITRYGVPLSSFVRFLARVGDDFERDVRAAANETTGLTIGARVMNQLPGFLGAVGIPNREDLPEALDLFGDPTPNSQKAPAGLFPYYQGRASRQGDAITEELERAGVGMPRVGDTITFRGMEVPLRPAERREFDRVWGESFRRELEGIQASGKKYPDEAYVMARDEARKDAVGAILDRLGPDEIKRRVEGSREP